VYEGKFSNNYPNGADTYTNGKGKKFYCSGWKNGDMGGDCRITSPTCIIIFDGKMVDNYRQGYGGSFVEATRTIYSGHYVKDKFEGRGISKKADGFYYDGYFSRGVENGQGVMITTDGRKIIGNFIDGKPYANCTITNNGTAPVKAN